jgi:peptidyl-prolyl cis-trans isomerase D
LPRGCPSDKNEPMLDALRRGVANFVAKILLGLLVIAFAIWGVADVFRGYGRGTIARIGATEISVEDFQQAYNSDLAAVSARLGRRLTTEEARRLGLDSRALARLVAGAAIDTHARELHLSLSDAVLADSIRSDPAFQGPDGAFSRPSFNAFLRQNGLSEARYIVERRKEDVRGQLTGALVAGLAPPQLLVELLHRYREEKRVLSHFTLDPEKTVKLAEPDESALTAYFEKNKGHYVTPELRKFAFLSLTRADVKRRVEVTEQEVKAAYEAEKQKFNIPEKRRILQLSFADKAAAEKAYAELVRAKNFKETAAKLGFKESDFDLGLLSRSELIDPKVAEVAFALRKDELSRPVEGQFATVLLRVAEIVPSKQRTYDEVKGEIRDRLAGERASQEIEALHEKVDKERNAGKSLKEIAENLHLPFHEVAQSDRAGKTEDGKTAFDHPEAAKILEAVFSGMRGLDIDPVDLGEGGYAWIDLQETYAERQKTFQEVKDQVRAAYMESERQKELSALAAKLVARARQGESFAALAKEVGGKVDKTEPVTRATRPHGLSVNAVQQAFALPKGGVGSASTEDNKSRTIFRVEDIVAAPAPTPEQSERLKAEITRQLESDVLSEYVGGLQDRYGLAINEQSLRQVIGAEPQQ